MTVPLDLDAALFGEDESFQKPASRSTDALPHANTKQAPESRGPLLDEPDEKKVAETITKWLKDQAKARKRRRVIATRNRLWLKGKRGIQVRPVNEDITELELYQSWSSLGMSNIMARAGQLLERVISHLLSDQPAPEAEPEDDSDAAREAAEVTTRILTVEGAESGFNTGGLLRRAERKAGVWGSGFLYSCVDPTGGGWRPMEIEALQEAQTVDDATVDPMTGMPLATGDPRLTIRWVRPDKTLTDDPNEADKQWLPKIRVEVLTPDNVALLPEVCSGVADADGCIIIQYPRISEARAKFPLFAQFDEDEVRALLGWRPEDARSAPWDSAGERLKVGNSATSGELDDQSRLCTLSLYFKSHGAYPTGAYIVVCGDKVLYREPWSGMTETVPEDEPETPDPAVAGSIGPKAPPRPKKPGLIEECLDLPLAQIRQLDDDVDDDPMGMGLVGELGEIDEQRAYILNAWNDYLDQSLHKITFVPMGSNLHAGAIQMARQTGEPLYFNPQGKPEQERIDPFSPDGKEFFDRTTQAGNEASGLMETAQGNEAPSVTSGAQAAVVVQQAAQNMSAIKHNLADGTERFWRIVVQLIRVYFTIPMQAKYLGEDSSWRLTEWTRADLRSTRVIKIKAGTFTQQTAQQKEATADKQLQMQVIDQNEYRDLVRSGIRPTLGLKENPHIVRVKRQISLWDDGPPEGWQPPPPPMMLDPMTQQPVPAVDPMTGQPMPAPPDPANPFADQRLIDQDQMVALERFTELAKHQAEARYIRKPAPWRAYYDAAFNESRMACGKYTLAEQQAAAAQQQQQQAAQAQASDASKQQADATKQASSQAHETNKLQIAGQQKAEAQSVAHAAKAADQRATNLLTA